MYGQEKTSLASISDEFSEDYMEEHKLALAGEIEVTTETRKCQCPFCRDGICTKIDLGKNEYRYACPRCFTLFHVDDWELDNGKLLRKTQKILPPKEMPKLGKHSMML